MRLPDCGWSARTLLLAALLVSSTALGALNASAYTPKNGDSFSYSETITVSNGAGVYQGYTDQSLISGSEQVTGVSSGIVSAQYQYSYKYSSSQGSSTSSTSSGPYAWSDANFTYVSGTDDQVGYTAPIYVWFAMNASLPVGASFNVLNTQFTVLSKDYAFQLPTENEYVQAIRAEGTGQYQRDDSYGVFTATYTWYEYFDPSTGYIIGYSYVEQDVGQYQGQTGSFTYTDNLYVTTTSYPITLASGPTTTTSTSSGGISVPYLDFLVLGAIVFIVLVAVIVAAMRSRGRRSRLPEHSQPPTPPSAPPPAPPSAPPTPWQSGIDLGSKPPEQVVIREIAMVNCKFCGTLIPSTAETCPHCGAPRQ